MKWFLINRKTMQDVRYSASDRDAMLDLLWLETKIKTASYHIVRKTPAEIILSPVKGYHPTEDIKVALFTMLENATPTAGADLT